MEGGVSIGLNTRFSIEKWSLFRGVSEGLTFDNIVLDVGWKNLKARLLTTEATPGFLYLGTGTSTPSESDLGLISLSETLGGKEASSITHSTPVLDAGSEKIVAKAFLRFDYGPGEAEGVWNEMGLAFGESYNDPYNRALFRDEEGDPISLTVLSDEHLRVFVELTMHLPGGVVSSGTMMVDGEERQWTLKSNERFEEDRAYGNRANPWREGLIRHIQAIDADLEEDISTDFNVSDAVATYTISEPPGDSKTISGFMLRSRRNAQPSHNTHQYDLVFDPPIEKGGQDRLEGSFSIAIERGDPPE